MDRWNIRIEAYRELGFTKKSLSDPDEDVRNAAEIYFRSKALRKEEAKKIVDLWKLEKL